MKNLINKVRHHGKKITIYLKSQPKWVVRCMFGIGAILGLVLSLHTHPIGGTNAQSIECPEGQYLATGDVCITNEKDIVIQATATESDQTLTMNKYFSNDYIVARGDGTTGDLVAHTTHTYTESGVYNIILSLSGADRWTFTNSNYDNKSLVPISGTTVTGVQIVYMPSLAEGFGNSADAPGDYFFYFFNADGALTSLPEGSFNTSNITTAGDYFFSCFNGRLVEGGTLTSLPNNSFDISNITTVGDHFFSYFNSKGDLTSLPTGSFNTSNITSVGDYFFDAFNVMGELTSLPDESFKLSTGLITVGNSFFCQFNDFGKITTLPDRSFDTSNIISVGNFFFDEFNGNGALTSLPDGSFNLSNITTAGNRFFSYFNSNGALTSLPDSFKLNYVGSQSVSGYQNAFNSSFILNKNVSTLVSGLTTPLDDRNVFSDNQPGRCGVDSNWLASTGSACSITYMPNGGSEIVNPKKKYEANTTGVVAGDGIETPTRTGYALSGWYTAEQGGDLVDIVVFPNMDGGTLYAQWIDTTPPNCDVAYSTTGPTNQDVIATLTGCSEPVTVTNNDRSMEYTFENTGTFTFEFQDLAGNTGEAIATVDRIDKVAPTCNVIYNTTGTTTGNVVANLTGCSEKITGTNLQHTFTGNETYTFNFQDLAGNIGTELAEVTWIDKTKPTCDVIYSTTGATTGNVTATLTGCSGTVTGTNLQHTFTGNGTYTFNFQNLLGNTGNVVAEVTWIVTYPDIEGNQFRWNDLTICNPNKSGECITMMDRNLGATTNDVSKTGSYGYYFQRGNNYGFSPKLESLTTGETLVNASSYGPGNYYNRAIYNILPRNMIYARDRSTVRNDNLWGGSGDIKDNNYGYPVQNPSDRQGPCPNGYHVPSMGERLKVVKWWALNHSGIGYGNPLRYDDWGRPALSGEISRFRSDLFIPESKSFYTDRSDFENLYNIHESLNFLRSSSPIPYSSGDYTEFGFVPHNTDNRSSRILYLDTLRSSSIGEGRDIAAPIRCFKNSYETGNTFSISIDEVIKPGEYTTFTVTAIKDGQQFHDYTGTILFILTNKSGGLVNKKNYTLSNSGRYTFELNDGGKKIFYSGLKINEAGTYTLEVNGLKDGIKGSTVITVGVSHKSAEFKYDTLKFNPNYSDEMNQAYQYARYFDITTKNSIKDADMYSGLNRIAMAKMLTNYAENVLGKNNFNTGRNCTFKDVSTSLDKDYDYGVTKACQLGIMGVNMPDNRFYPNGGVTRAEFATALSRLLYNTKDGTERYYSTHITKLRREGIITNTDPALWELRGYVMLMLKRVAEK